MYTIMILSLFKLLSPTTLLLSENNQRSHLCLQNTPKSLRSPTREEILTTSYPFTLHEICEWNNVTLFINDIFFFFMLFALVA